MYYYVIDWEERSFQCFSEWVSVKMYLEVNGILNEDLGSRYMIIRGTNLTVVDKHEFK